MIHCALRIREKPNTASLFTDLAERGHDGVWKLVPAHRLRE
jgi:hypothetical protein